MKTRIQKRFYALVNASGEMWDNRLGESRSEIYTEYGSKQAAIEDKWTAKEVTIYYTLINTPQSTNS
jgi:hypothetical protein